MRPQKQSFLVKHSMFGTDIFLNGPDTNVKIVEQANFDFMGNNNLKLKTGYLFRSPNVQSRDWYDVLCGLANVEGGFKLWAVSHDNKINCYVLLADQGDAAMFALGNTVHWQKWSDEAEAAEAKELKSKKKKPKVKVNKDGSITVKVTVETLDKA